MYLISLKEVTSQLDAMELGGFPIKEMLFNVYYEAYIVHLQASVDDKFIKAIDRAKLLQFLYWLHIHQMCKKIMHGLTSSIPVKNCKGLLW